MDTVICDYVWDLKPAMLAARLDRVFVTHSGCGPTTIDLVRSELKQMDYFLLLGLAV